MADGKGCKCGAYDQSECGCDADWTPQEVYDLRSELKELKSLVRRFFKETIYVPYRAVDCDQYAVETLHDKLLAATKIKRQSRKTHERNPRT